MKNNQNVYSEGEKSNQSSNISTDSCVNLEISKGIRGKTEIIDKLKFIFLNSFKLFVSDGIIPVFALSV